jgi:trehalose 6-phosphate phosphatase
MAVAASHIEPSHMDLPDLRDREQIALFLDFDGTLVAIADRPDEVKLDPITRQALAELSRLLSGALAIITGREISSVDRFLAPLHLPVAGVHGLTRRDARGHMHAPPIDVGLAEAIGRAMSPLIARHPGLMLERKYGALALHYRSRPELEGTCIAAMETAIAGLPGTELKRGKMVIEAKAIAGDKGAAIADYLKEVPFLGRRAVFAGDDATDEDAFLLVNAKNGVSIKIGPGLTHAAFSAPGSANFWPGCEPCRRSLEVKPLEQPRSRPDRKLQHQRADRPPGAHRLVLPAALRRRSGFPCADWRAA